MVDIRTSCYAARLAAFSCPQKHWKALIFRGALKRNCLGVIFDAAGLKAVDNADELARESPQSLYWVHDRVT
jgi:hypothetical protein